MLLRFYGYELVEEDVELLFSWFKPRNEQGEQFCFANFCKAVYEADYPDNHVKVENRAC